MNIDLIKLLGVISITYFTIFCFLISIINHIKNKKNTPTTNNIQDLDILMGIIEDTIKRVFLEKYKLEYELKDIRMIYDFEKDLSELVHKVVMSFNKPFMKSLEYYYTETYIIGYITKTIEMMLMEFIKEKKLKIR